MDNETLIDELILKIESILSFGNQEERKLKLDKLKSIFSRSDLSNENKVNALARATRHGVITLAEANYIW